MNVCILSGCLVRDAELKKSGNGTSIASGVIAVSRERRDANGEYGTDFINFVAWDKQAEYIVKQARKGSRMELVGRWQVRTYNDKDGEKVTVNELVVEKVNVFASASAKASTPKAEPKQEPLPDIDLDDEESLDYDEDDLPF